MRLNFVARHIQVTDRFHNYVSEKLAKVEQLSDKALELDVTVSRHHGGKGLVGGDRVELTLVGRGPVIRAESDGEDKYAAFDLALGRLLERLRRAKDKKKVHRGGAHHLTSLQEASADGFAGLDVTPASTQALGIDTGTFENPHEDEDYSPILIRQKVFSATPMTLDDALYNMEAVGHDFYLYVDAETGRPSVVYRRKGWHYGVIGIDTEVAAQRAS
ncbi:MAG: ribosome-associated translation inhibitor RaiA [Microbacteriaceae bacterium]|nr:ribosome-associated translation inhibitor RaiA [Microbacteriaceae bacterium]